jgi:hypothetical protein
MFLILINVLGKFLELYLNFFHLFFYYLISFYNIYVFVRLFVVILLDTFYDFLPDLECFSKFDQVSYEK